MKKNILALVLLLVVPQIFTFPNSVKADESNRDQKALKLISDYVNEHCKEVPLSGTQKTFEASAGAKLGLNKLIAKVAELGLEGAIKYTKTEYEGYLQKDLVSALKESNNCKIQLTIILTDTLLAKNNYSNLDNKSKKNYHLNNDHFVFIKTDTSLTSTEESSDPYKQNFILTNSSKLIAHVVKIIVYESSGNLSSNTMSVVGHQASQQVEALIGVTVYPGNDIPFHIPSTTMNGSCNEVKFIITYKLDGSNNEIKDILKFINTPDTKRHWQYVSNDYYLFKQPLIIKSETDNAILSDTTISLMQKIISDLLGSDFVIKSNSKKLNRAFSKICVEIRKNGGWDKTFTISSGALAELMNINIIDKHNVLTKYGVKVFKKIANYLKSSDNPYLSAKA